MEQATHNAVEQGLRRSARLAAALASSARSAWPKVGATVLTVARTRSPAAVGTGSEAIVTGTVPPSLRSPTSLTRSPYSAGPTARARMRVKESDRISVLAENLRRMGAQVDELPDGLRVAGRSAGQLHGAEIEPHGDHRMAMAFAIAALGAKGETVIRDAECAAVSYPDFFLTLDRMVER